MYSSGGFVAALIISPFAGRLLAIWGPDQLQRVATALVALVSVPQGIANLFGSAGAFVAITFSLRTVEAAAIATAEVAVQAAICACTPPRMNARGKRHTDGGG